MICPNDGNQLTSVDRRQREGYVSRTYKCPKCGSRFYTAEVFRDIGTPGKQLNISGEAFGKQFIQEAKQKLADKLRALADSVLED
jgi:transcriptional regulator NrdR family protein